MKNSEFDSIITKLDAELAARLDKLIQTADKAHKAATTARQTLDKERQKHQG